MADCQVKSEFKQKCKGRRRTFKMEVYWQPSGEGTFRVPTTVVVCDEHKRLIGSGSYCHASFKEKKPSTKCGECGRNLNGYLSSTDPLARYRGHLCRYCAGTEEGSV